MIWIAIAAGVVAIGCLLYLLVTIVRDVLERVDL